VELDGWEGGSGVELGGIFVDYIYAWRRRWEVFGDGWEEMDGKEKGGGHMWFVRKLWFFLGRRDSFFLLNAIFMRSIKNSAYGLGKFIWEIFYERSICFQRLMYLSCC
jgi:hypothetical protein